jgi:hypothetical protein
VRASGESYAGTITAAGTIPSMRRLLAPALVLVVGASACQRDVEPPAASPTPIASAPVTPPPSASAPPSPSASPPVPPSIPAGIPPSFDDDVAAADLPVGGLIPRGNEVTDRLLATTSAGDAVVVMYAKRGGDPFMRAQGFVVWRRTEGATPPWTPVLGLTHLKTDGVIAIQGITGDATGDGSGDALLFEATGGVGNCGSWRVIDLAAGVQRWARSLCDAQVDLNVDPPGLRVTETVYEAGDPHCCPSAIRTSVWEFDPSQGFTKTSQETTPF